MKIDFNKNTGEVSLSIDQDNYDQDKEKCKRLEELYTSENWVILLELLSIIEEKLHMAAITVKPQEQSFRESAILSARNQGFLEAMKVLPKAVKAYNDNLKERKKVVSAQIDEILGKDEIIND